jgi:hypothetical protein
MDVCVNRFNTNIEEQKEVILHLDKRFGRWHYD